MKKVILFFIVIFIASCHSEDYEITKTPDSSNKIENLNLSKIGTKKGDDIVLNVSKEMLLEVFRADSKKYILGINPVSCKIEKINAKDYLRFYNEDKTVSTIELLVDGNGNVTTGKTICTSDICATGGGCIPDGQYCTKCQPPGQPPAHPGGDCLRTTIELTPDPNP